MNLFLMGHSEMHSKNSLHISICTIITTFGITRSLQFKAVYNVLSYAETKYKFLQNNPMALQYNIEMSGGYFLPYWSENVRVVP